MKKIIFPCVVLGIYSIAYAEQPKLEQYTQLTFYEFASLDTWPIDHVNEFRKALNEKYSAHDKKSAPTNFHGFGG